MDKITLFSLVFLSCFAVLKADGPPNNASTPIPDNTTVATTFEFTTVTATPAPTTVNLTTEPSNGTSVLTTVPVETTAVTTANPNITTEAATTVPPTTATAEVVTTSNITVPPPTTEAPTQTTALPTMPTRPASTEAPGVNWNVENATTVCILAEFNADVIVGYNTTDGVKYAVFPVPQSAKVVPGASGCDFGPLQQDTQKIQLGFSGTKQHNLSLIFNRDANGTASVSSIIFDYDLSDTTYFPNATWNASAEDPRQTAVSGNKLTEIPKDTYYVCASNVTVDLENKKDGTKLGLSFTNTKLQAYRESKTKQFTGANSVCPKDEVTTTFAPTTTALPPINTANYTLRDSKGNVCLLMSYSVSVDLKYKQLNGSWENATIGDVNNGTVVERMSHCDNQSAYVVIGDTWIPKWFYGFNFTSDGKKYTLKNVFIDFALENSSVIVNANNTSQHNLTTGELNAWQGTVGRSYKCESSGIPKFNVDAVKEFVTDFQLVITDLQVQPFMDVNATHPNFGEADECAADYTSDIVPIAVGCALAALVVIVLIAYVIGRRRNRARGYESM